MTPAYADIKRLLGDLDDHAIAEIEGSGITMSQLEEVAAHLAQETDVRSISTCGKAGIAVGARQLTE